MIKQNIRSIICQTGGTSYTLVLPKDWCRAHGLHGGSKVRLEEEGNDLRIIVIGEQDA